MNLGSLVQVFSPLRVSGNLQTSAKSHITPSRSKIRSL
jgi:hypothetical protein